MKYFLLLSILFFSIDLKGQTLNFEHKSIGIYISKKNISYTPYFHKILSSFVLAQEDTLDLMEEELKLGLSIKLGEFLLSLLKQSFQSESMYFINKHPLLARSFIKSYQEKKINNYEFLKYLPYSTDYFIIIDDLKLKDAIERDVLSFSNQIFTIKRHFIEVELTLVLINLKEKKTKVISVKYNSKDGSPTNRILKMNRPFQNKGEELFYHIFNVGFLSLVD